MVLNAETQVVEGRSGEAVRLRVKTAAGDRTIEGSDILVAAGRTPNTREIGLEEGYRARRARLCEGGRSSPGHCGRSLGNGRVRR